MGCRTGKKAGCGCGEDLSLNLTQQMQEPRAGRELGPESPLRNMQKSCSRRYIYLFRVWNGAFELIQRGKETLGNIWEYTYICVLLLFFKLFLKFIF